MRDIPRKTINSRLANSLAFSASMTLGLVVTSGVIDSRLGVPQYWPWLLTSLQVLALWGAGGRRWWGWLLGASVQPPWIAYAILTGQLGFIPGCAISAVVQTYSFLRTFRVPEVSVPGSSRIVGGAPQGRSPIDVSAYGASLSVLTEVRHSPVL